MSMRVIDGQEGYVRVRSVEFGRCQEDLLHMFFTRRDRGRECTDDAHRRQRETEMVGRPNLRRSRYVGKRASGEAMMERDVRPSFEGLERRGGGSQTG